MLNLNNEKILCSYIGIVAMLLLTFITPTIAGPSPTVRSVKAVILHEGSAYVAAGYPENHRPFQDELDALWQATPSKDQEMRPVTLDALESIMGGIDRHYVVLLRHIKYCPSIGTCFPDRIDVAVVDVEVAMLAMWGCGPAGLDTVVPVLRLKTWPWGEDDTDAIAVGVSPTNGWKAERLRREDISPTLRRLIPPFGGIARVTDINNNLSFFFLHDLSEIVYQHAVAILPLSNPPVLLDAVWPTSGC